MSILIFFIILSALVIVHELGHFLAARSFGIRVDEFGLGYPPRARKLFRWKGTDFTLNWLPFGGFVKIFGESYEEDLHKATKDPSSFQYKNRAVQAVVLFAGVFFNFLFAWTLIAAGLVGGLPAPLGGDLPVENPRTVITAVLPGSPAEAAGLKAGDTLVSINNAPLSPEEAALVIGGASAPLDFAVERGDVLTHASVTPAEGIVAGQKAVGISMESVGTVRLPLHRAVIEGVKITWSLTLSTAEALAGFLRQALVGRADLSSVTGPVGLVGMVGEATELGWGYLIAFTALISINLSLINLLPFPALDGGRLLFVLIESLIRRPIPARVFNFANLIGFFLLVLLMILITAHDVQVIL